MNNGSLYDDLLELQHKLRELKREIGKLDKGVDEDDVRRIEAFLEYLKVKEKELSKQPTSLSGLVKMLNEYADLMVNLGAMKKYFLDLKEKYRGRI